MPSCAAPSCNNRSSDHMYHRFPPLKALKTEWIGKIKRLNADHNSRTPGGSDSLWQPTSSSRLCSAHFSDDSYSLVRGRKVLKSDAIPTIFPFSRPTVSRRKLPKDREKPKERGAATSVCSTTFDHCYSGEMIQSRIQKECISTSTYGILQDLFTNGGNLLDTGYHKYSR